MTSPIILEKPKSGWLIALFALSIGAHFALAVLLIWAGKHLPGPPQKQEELVDLGMDVQLGTEVQELIVAENNPPTPEPLPPEPPEPPPPPPEPAPPDPEPPPEPPEMPEFIEPKPEPKATPKATPAPKPKVIARPAPAPAAAPPGAKVGPTPRPGVIGGNVTQGATTGTPGGQKIGTGWRTPRGPYPGAALARRITGTIQVRAATNASGKVISASTSGADPILQSAARQMALSSWQGPPNQSKTVTVVYRIP